MRMENCPLSGIGQLCSESVSDAKSRFWQPCSPPVSRAELVCPEPRRATSIPFVLDSVNRFVPKSKGIFPVHGGNHCMELLDIILNKDELEGGSDPSNQKGFYCGSPPIRTNNPVVHDAEFAKLTQLPFPSVNSHGSKASRSDKGSPSSSCGSSLGAKPMVRVEGFACESPESSRIVPAFA